MEVIMYLLGVLAVGGVALAIYEWRKDIRIVQDTPEHHKPHDREQAAFVEAQRIAAQHNPTQMPGNF